MHPDMEINGFIEDYTGITNEMLRDAAPCAEVMNRFADFIGNDNLVAHNASFDKRFLDAELDFISRDYPGQFACSMLLARRVYQDATNHKLGTLVEYANIPSDGNYHRALYDSEMTTQLWLAMLDNLARRCDIKSVPFTLTQELAKTPIKSVGQFLASWGT